MLVITMTSLNPILLLASFITSLIELLFLERDKSKLKTLIYLAIPVLIFMIIIQPLFSHTGSKVLFYINSSGVYLENYIYGAIVSLMLLASINWCFLIRILIDSEKMFYLFGKFSPSLGLFFTMTLRFIPLVKERLKEVDEGQKAMGLIRPDKGFLVNTRIRLKEFSVLLGWSIESSLETANSMESRGYGLKNRTSYHRFVLKKRDVVTIIIEAVIFIYIFWQILSKAFRVYYLPIIILNKWNVLNILAIIVFIIEAMLPVIIEIGNRRAN